MGGGEADRAERGGARGTDPVARPQDRIGTADVRRPVGTEVRGFENLAQRGERHVDYPFSTTRPSTATTPSRLTISGLISASATG